MYMPVHKTFIDNALASVPVPVPVCVLPYLVAEHKTAQIIKTSHILCGLPPLPLSPQSKYYAPLPAESAMELNAQPKKKKNPTIKQH